MQAKFVGCRPAFAAIRRATKPRQSNMEKLTLIILTMALSITMECGVTSPNEISPFDNPQPVEPKIKEIQVEKVGALTGNNSPTEMKSIDVCGTDLGTMTEIGNRIFFAFGDTFGYDGDICRGIGGPNWRSNVFASTTDHDPADRVVLEDWLRGPDGKAIAVLEGAQQQAFTGEDSAQTKIPTAMVSVGDPIYLHYMSVHGFRAVGGLWDCNYSKFVYSATLRKPFNKTDPTFYTHNSNSNML